MPGAKAPGLESEGRWRTLEASTHSGALLFESDGLASGLGWRRSIASFGPFDNTTARWYTFFDLVQVQCGAVLW